ncbi:hypothetical protein KIN20_027821 [Parelaphostrongylus tenuis]|uniref:Uncharacterized protein n=1 Tax=Parelaphostrongylus tenuis TaxID=148309 RepID=A0AAD5WE64_PARTN|nr:hypothetical protein KIN20_027821 [Parelaphostrongylus tenuis]
MVHSGNTAVSSRIPNIATSAAGAMGFVQRLVTQTKVKPVVHILPDAVISTILDQLEVKITYEPLSCQKKFNRNKLQYQKSIVKSLGSKFGDVDHVSDEILLLPTGLIHE